MQTLKQQVERLTALTAQIAQKQPEAINLLNQIYMAIFNETIQQGCGNCYQKAFFRIQKFMLMQSQNNPVMKQTERKFLLHKGKALQTVFGGDYITNDNLTDVIAARVLLNAPALLKHFERYPTNQTGMLDEDAVLEIPVNSAILTEPDEPKGSTQPDISHSQSTTEQ